VLGILERPSAFRAPDEVDFVVEVFQHLKFWKDLSIDQAMLSDVIHQCTEQFQLEIFNSGEALFHYGDIGNKFYIMVKGSVDIFVPINEWQKPGEPAVPGQGSPMVAQPTQPLPSPQKTEESPTISPARSTNLAPFIDDVDPVVTMAGAGGGGFARNLTVKLPGNLNQMLANEADHSPFLKYLKKSKGFFNMSMRVKPVVLSHIEVAVDLETVIRIEPDKFRLYYGEPELAGKANAFLFKKKRTLGVGTTFGDVAINTKSLRTASVFARSSPTIVVSLSKMAFHRIFELQIRKLEKKLDFFREHFNLHSKYTLLRLAYNFSERTYAINTNVFREGDPVDEFYIIHTGEILVLILLSALSRYSADERRPRTYDGD
jgi:CRP-like cAMP-binding protein